MHSLNCKPNRLLIIKLRFVLLLTLTDAGRCEPCGKRLRRRLRWRAWIHPHETQTSDHCMSADQGLTSFVRAAHSQHLKALELNLHWAKVETGCDHIDNKMKTNLDCKPSAWMFRMSRHDKPVELCSTTAKFVCFHTVDWADRGHIFLLCSYEFPVGT